MHRLPRGGRDFYGRQAPSELDTHNVKVELASYDAATEIVPSTTATPKPAPAAAGPATHPSEVPAPAAETRALTSAEAAELFGRVAPVAAVNDDLKDFAARDASLKAPKAGVVTCMPFPPPPEARAEAAVSPAELARLAKAEAGPLTVTRYTPQQPPQGGSRGGELVTSVSITFSQPMVDMDSVAANAQTKVAEITPTPPGRWVWKGVSTLQYESPDASGRFPASTKFKVSVPLGTTSKLGGLLDKALAFEFATETVKITDHYPREGYTDLKPIIFLAFNQKINPDAVMANLALNIGKSTVKSSGLKRLTEDDVKGDDNTKHLVEHTPAGQWLAVRPAADLPKNAHIEVAIFSAAISAEGPVPADALGFRFRTYPEFCLSPQQCHPNASYPADPSSQWTLAFTTPVDKASFKKEMITITPPISFKVVVQTCISITPLDAKENTAYKVSLSKSLKDTFGQTLVDPCTVTLPTGKHHIYPMLKMSEGYLVMDPALSQPFLEVTVRNFAEIVIEVNQVDPADYNTYEAQRYQWSHDRREKEYCRIGRLVHTETVKVNGKVDEEVKVKVNLGQHLQFPKETLGHVVVCVFPTAPSWTKFYPDPDNRRNVSTAWVACTQMSVDLVQSTSPASVDLHAWVNALKDGAPIAGAVIECKVTKQASGGAYRAAQVEKRSCPNKHPLIFMLSPSAKSWKCADCSKLGLKAMKAWHCMKCPASYDLCEDCYKKPPKAAADSETPPTDATGLTKVNVLPPGGASAAERALVIASKGNDRAFCHVNSLRKAEYAKWTWFIFNDRGLYRPKEEVYIKGYLRGWLRDGQVMTPQYAKPKAECPYSIRDVRGQEIAKSKITLNQFGAFSVKFTLPDTVNLGQASFSIEAPMEGQTVFGYQTIRVEEFRRPEYECKASVRPPTGHVTAGDPIKAGFAIANVKASYFSGGSLSDAKVRWTVQAAAASYSPPGWGEFSFGNVHRWWFSGGDSEGRLPIPDAHLEATSNADGEHELKIAYSGNYKKRPTPITFTARAEVTDLNNQSIQASTSFIAHPSAFYVGAKLTKWWAPKEEAVPVDVIVTNHDGVLIADQAVTATVTRKFGEMKEQPNGTSKWTESTECKEFTLQSGAAPVTWKLTPWEGGTYSVTFTVADANGLRSATVAKGISVTGGQLSAPAAGDGSTLTAEQLVLIPNKKEYNPGDNAEFLVQCPFAPSEGLLTVTADAVVYTKRFRMESYAAPVSVPIDLNWLPNANVSVTLVGKQPRGGAPIVAVTCLKQHALARIVPYEGKGWNCDGCSAAAVKEAWHCEQCGYDLCDACHAAKKTQLPPADQTTNTVPALATGSMRITISRQERTLSVAAQPSAPVYKPGADARIDVAVTSFDGKPVPNAEVCLVCADESVVSLAGHKIANPINLFYPDRADNGGSAHLRSSVWLLRVLPEEEAPQTPPDAAADAADDGSDSSGGEELQEREEKSKESGGSRQMMMKSKKDRSEGKGGGGGGDGFGAPMASGAPGSPAPRAKAFALSSSLAAAPSPRRARRSSLRGGGGGGGDNADEGANTGPIDLRKNFTPIAKFEESVVTNASGKVSVSFKLPDSLTRYRVWAVAVTEVLYGVGESAVNVALPLMVRPSPPRFLNLGDKADLSVVLVNQSAAAVDVRVALRASNAALRDLTQGGYALRLAVGQRTAVTFPVQTHRPGIARFQVVAAANNSADAAEFELPVWTPATGEAFATYGTVDGASAVVLQPIKTPADVIKDFGGIEVTTSSTALASLTDAAIDLIRYPFDCCEQIASRVLGVIGLKDILAAFNVSGLPNTERLLQSLERDLHNLKGRQYPNGGFGWWSMYSLSPPSPYITCHVAHMLGRAKAAGLKVPEEMFERTVRYLKAIESNLVGWYGKATRASICAYAVYARARMGDATVKDEPAAFYKKYQADFTLEGLAWILSALHYAQTVNKQKNAELIAAILKTIANKAVESADTVSFACKYGDDGTLVMLHSDRRSDAVVMDVLLDVEPNSGLIPKVVKGLLAHRKQGKWHNTQENGMILVALDHYFKVYEKETPDFVARMWLGDAYAGEQKFKGRSTESNSVNVPMRYLFQNRDPDLVVQKEGAGRLYYRVGLTYAHTELKLKPASYGFKVERTYEGVDEPRDVTTDAKGVIRVKLGAKVKVTLKLIAVARRYHVALVDKLPAGFEALNPALPGTPAVPLQEASVRRRWFDPVNWFDHQNLRDERVEAFKDLLWEGIYTYSYFARATTAGEFIVPPAKAEEMYSPEIFGRSSSLSMVIA